MRTKGIYWWLAGMFFFAIAMVFIAIRIYYHPFNLIRQDIGVLDQKMEEIIRNGARQEKQIEKLLKKINVTLTAYNATKAQCDDTPFTTASSIRVREGIVALSRDLEKRYNLKFGDLIYIEGIGLFEFQDRMHRRWKNKVDIFMWSRQRAIQFGKQSGKIVIM
jgi:3D (Asp-Asp-Asp) domain-containing protein